MTTLKMTGAITAALLLFQVAVALHSASSTEQTHFSVEGEPVEHPVSIPLEILESLRKDGGIGQELDDDSSDNPTRSSLLEASLIHLRSSRQDDMIVIAKGSLAGANVTRFWVFLRTSSGMKLALNGAAAHDLEIKPTRNNGYRNIVLLSATAGAWSETVLHFDGKEYRQFSTRTHRS